MRLRLRFVSVAVLALVAACNDARTSVKLAVVYEPGWNLEELRVTAGTSTVTAVPSPTVLVLVPDAWAGQPLTIDIAGRSGGHDVASGAVDVTPVIGAEIEATVVLAPPVCGAWCTPGTLACQGDGVVTCEERADGCRQWSAPVACPTDAPFCSLGACGADCVDECVSGHTRCAGPDGVQLCGEADSDDCTDWLAPTACPDTEVCSNGACGPSCTDECTDGMVICTGAGTSTCGDLDSDGCTEWGPEVACPDHQTCSGGSCSIDCTDDCTASACTGLTYDECGQFDLDPCMDVSATSCVPTNPCRIGACTISGCTSTPVVCDDPDPPVCVDATTLRTYSAAGTCSGGDCSYPFTDTTCATACDSGACCTPGPWMTTTIGPGGTQSGDSVSLTLDAAGGVHACFRKEVATNVVELWYGHLAPGATTWTTSRVSTDSVFPGADAIAVDADGTVHIAYERNGPSTDDQLIHAYRPVGVGAFTLQQIPLGPSPDGYWLLDREAAIAIATDGTIHVAYTCYQNSDYMSLHAWLPPGSGTWSRSTIDSSTSLYEASMAEGAGGRVHIAYTGSAGAYYAERSPTGTWVPIVLDDTVDQTSGSEGIGLAVGTGGAIHVVYVDADGRLAYAHRSGGTWSIAPIPGTPSSDFPAVAVDGGGTVHVVFTNASEDLMYAVRPPGGGWTVSTADGTANVWGRTSLAVDATGGLHAGYSDPDFGGSGSMKTRYTHRDACP